MFPVIINTQGYKRLANLVWYQSYIKFSINAGFLIFAFESNKIFPRFFMLSNTKNPPLISMHCLWLYLQKILCMQVSQYTLYHCIKGLLIWYTFSCCLRSNEKVNDGWKLLDICFFCFAGLILDDCLELSCLLLVFHKCNSKNNEIHKKPILYECKLWLLIDKTIKQSLYRHLGPCLLFSWEACFACGTIFDLRLQDIIQDKSIYASCKYLKLHLHRRRA